MDLRRFRQQKVLVGLARIRLHRVRLHDDVAVEDASPVAIDHALVKLAAGALRCGVLDRRRVVEVLPASRQIQAVQHNLRLGGLERDLHLVSGERRAEGDRVRGEPACASLVDIHERQMER